MCMTSVVHAGMPACYIRWHLLGDGAICRVSGLERKKMNVVRKRFLHSRKGCLIEFTPVAYGCLAIADNWWVVQL